VVQKIKMSGLKAIISGGGTGGHIFPAIAIANALKSLIPNIDILFVGALGKMEMEKVPEAGYEIVGLPIRGIKRSLSVSNLKVPFLLIKSLFMSRKAIQAFKPDVVVGVGGYASAAVVYTASKMGIKSLIQEQNSYPGITNKILSKKVDRICVAFEGMETYFPKSKLLLTGNPIRQDIFSVQSKSEESEEYFQLDKSKTTILAFGGSLGARTINRCMLKVVPHLKSLNAQLIWQCGSSNYSHYQAEVEKLNVPEVHLHEFIKRMDLAYSASDFVISRAGALSVSEITALAKPSILIPSPNVAEDHQTKNAMSLIKNEAAILLKDADAEAQIVPVLTDLLNNPEKINALKNNISKVFHNKNAAIDIAEEIKKLAIS